MKILILGGTGAIGTPLIAILRQNQDIQICVTSRSEHSSEENVQYLKADVLNQSAQLLYLYEIPSLLYEMLPLHCYLYNGLF